jgi:hypothetical protein
MMHTCVGICFPSTLTQRFISTTLSYVFLVRWHTFVSAERCIRFLSTFARDVGVPSLATFLERLFHVFFKVCSALAHVGIRCWHSVAVRFSTGCQSVICVCGVLAHVRTSSVDIFTRASLYVYVCMYKCR